MNLNAKCAPSKKFSEGSCFTIDSLKKIAENYNEKYDDKVRISNDKKQLLKDLTQKMKSRFECDDQTCWLSTNLVKSMKDYEIKHNTFRPVGPKKQYEWLSTSDINSVMKQYEAKHKDFLFLGALPYDFEELPYYGISNIDLLDVESQNKYQIGAVINLDEHDQPGSHWVALYAKLDENKLYYFDSFGKKPGRRINKFVRRILTHMYNSKYDKEFNVDQFMKKFHNSDDYDVRYNKTQHQFKNSECGVYSMNFIIRLLSGESFDDIVDNITKDEEMNACRKTYFIN
jgi:hypothetical protein